MSRLPDPVTEHDCIGSSSLTPVEMAVFSSSGTAGVAPVPLPSPVLIYVGWYPALRALLWVGSPMPPRISILSRTRATYED